MFGTRLVAQAAFAVVAPEPSSLAAILSLREATRRSNLEFHRHQKIRLLRRVAPRNDNIAAKLDGLGTTTANADCATNRVPNM